MIKKLSLAFVFAVALAGPAFAETYEVEMLNKGSDGARNVFSPAVIKIAPGDTIRFVATSKGHNAQSLDDALPDGATPFKTKLSKTEEVTFEAPGVYTYKCLPHYALGMVGVVVVGDDISNLEAVKAETGAAPGKAKQVFSDLLSGL
ncbi:pseudoazurin [Limibacillus halophilus]|uniref:Pseudoazurin n=1 Tax=Limibacillus halophilus TaxID=1579333 RepID=A0A839SWB6_9PROT|nr:pseudoazurin [Limibacillus halophilus]MBB3065243.1 pseudoazurin [Limibacillus halophilus]